MRKDFLRLLFRVLLGALTGLATSRAGTAQTLRAFNYPGATSTVLTGINTQGDLSGYYDGASGFYTYHFAIQNVSSKTSSYPWDLNDNYDVVGYYPTVGRGGYELGFEAHPGKQKLFFEISLPITRILNVTKAGHLSGFSTDFSYGMRGFFYVGDRTKFLNLPVSQDGYAISGRPTVTSGLLETW